MPFKYHSADLRLDNKANNGHLNNTPDQVQMGC